MVRCVSTFDLPSVTRKTHLTAVERRPWTRKIEQKAFTTHVCQAIQTRTNTFFRFYLTFLVLKVILITSEKNNANSSTEFFKVADFAL